MKECIFIKKETIDKALDQIPIAGKHHLEPLKSLLLQKKIPFGIMEDFEVAETEAEIHKKEGDVWFSLEGEVEFTYGGELVEPWAREGSFGNELGGKDIKGGTKTILRSGDWLWIPAGQPHMHKAFSVARLIVIKIPEAFV